MQSCFLCFDIWLLKTHKKVTRRSICSYQQYAQLTMTTSNFIASSQAHLTTQQTLRGGGDRGGDGSKIQDRWVGVVGKGNELTGVMQGVPGKKRFLVRFQDGCKNNLSSNQLTMVIVEKIPEEKEPEVFLIPEIPEEQVELKKGYYQCVYGMLRF